MRIMITAKSTLVHCSILLTMASFAILGSSCRSSIGMGDAVEETLIDESNKIPTKAFMGNPLFSHVTLSPNGRRIAVMVSRGDTDALIAIDLFDGTRTALAKLERRDSSHSTASNKINRVGWASNDYVVMSAERPLVSSGIRARRTVLLSSRVSDPRVRELGKDWKQFSRRQYEDRIISYLPNDPDRMLISWYGKAQQVDLKASSLRGVVLDKTRVAGWMADHEFKVRVGHSGDYFNTELGVWGRASEDETIKRLVRWDPYSTEEEGEGFYFAGFSDRPEMIYVRSERETGRFAIYEYDLRTRKLGPVVLADPEYEIGLTRARPYWDEEIAEVWTSRVDGRLLSIRYVDDVPRVHFVDAAHRRLWAPIHRAFEGKTVRAISTDQDETSSIFIVSADDSPPAYYRLDHVSGEYSRLFRSMPGLNDQPLSKMEPVEFQSREGLTIHGYVTRPAHAEGATATIVLPHGGPFSRDFRRWDPRVQFLASRGFTVFQLNYRGSIGYGRKFREAGYQQFGRAMQDDITDGVRWLIREGIADPAKIGIFGVGYGGYAALQGLVSTPDLYAAGASYAAITDIVTLLDDDNRAYWGARAVNRVLIGEQWEDRDLLREVSPAQHADQIKAPVLIGHGTDDWNHHIRHADQMANALDEAGAEYEIYRYLGESTDIFRYPGEAHEFIDERSRIGFYQKLGSFFERHLKPNPAHVRRPVEKVSARKNP